MMKRILRLPSICRTGNEVLDVLLAQRVAECQEKEIRFIPYIDGRNLDWMNVVDLCTLFGNAMDNAVEASEKIPEKESREITVKIENYGSMVVFRFVNCCESGQSRTGERFRTTKEDAGSHGYGLGSIRSIAEKYGGSMTAVCENSIFELVVLFPACSRD